MSHWPTPQGGPGSSVPILDENPPTEIVMSPDEIPITIHDDGENQPPDPTDEGRSGNPNVLQERAPSEPLPPYPGASTYPNGAGVDPNQEGWPDVWVYDLLTTNLREALAGASERFTTEEIDEARHYMCSTTLDNLNAAQHALHEAGDDLFDRYAKAMAFLEIAVTGARCYREAVLLGDRARVIPSSAIEFCLVTKILLPRLQEIVGLTEFLQSVSVLRPTG